MVNPSTANKERGDRKDRMYGPRYTPTLECNKFHYTAGLTVPNIITIPTIQPITEHNLALLVVVHPRRHGYKAAPKKREHKKTLPTLHPNTRVQQVSLHCGTYSYKQHNYTHDTPKDRP